LRTGLPQGPAHPPGRSLVTIGPTVLIIAAAFGVTMLFVKPAPPKRLTAAIAPDEGGSKYYARRYQEILKRHGITLEVRQTAGSLANVQLLAEPDSGVDIAFVQSGTDAGEKAAQIESLEASPMSRSGYSTGASPSTTSGH